ncbi:TPR repeat-containing thioredoxin TTL1-like isoform X2 [Dioscorea cayenensis subsp. rotundata]|uniref:TPR repeat-containing thioredoxin TTL1-like isoform X2 n=1 Tax=Dioscorea cayennensis subsp. rotundata TaxID=55577 RepID=A0AB40AMQ7_DIOCR|nr:TPR repeat-containing thioredoxin TTL1-like isoform X2 [Dioscorea cayenensis subsp. rotundata]
MSHSQKLGALSDRFHADLCLDGHGDKPDSKEFVDLGSPVSPLRNPHAAPTNTSSSSSSSGSSSVSGKAQRNAAVRKVSEGGAAGGRSHSGELSASGESSPTGFPSRPGHRRSGSGPLIYTSSGSTASSPMTNVLPAGNICPSGKIGKPGMMSRTPARNDVLGSGTGNYGHGSIMRGGAPKADSPTASGKPLSSLNHPEALTKAGNEHYKKGEFLDALKLYNRAVTMCPDNAACRYNKATALTGLGRLSEAVKEFEEAVRLDHGHGRAHLRLASLHLRLGQVESARRHLFASSAQQPDSVELQKLREVERHLRRCEESRKSSDWKGALRECDAAIAAGADSSPLLNAMKAEAFLRLHHLKEAESAICSASKYVPFSSNLQTKFVGMLNDAYIYIVWSHVEMALGRFESAVTMAEKAKHIDPRNVEVTVILSNVRSVAKARLEGNDFFKASNFAEACIAYGEGLKYDPSNSVLHCNRAACRSKLGQWEKSIEDCNEALKIQPNYTKALLRRATSYSKLERWVEAVRDYEVLRKELPGDNEVAEALFHAQVALKRSRGEEVSNMKFGGEVEEINGIEQFRAAIALPAVSNTQCTKLAPFVDLLCSRYPSVSFLKVDINEIPAVAKAENVMIVPTFKIYKNGTKVKEMICPSQQVLECSVRHYGL